MTDGELTVLLVEDDPETCAGIAAYAEKLDDFRLVDITNNSNRGMELIQKYWPDAVILDLELNKGGGSGLELLQILMNSPVVKMPYILVTTNNPSTTTHECARQMGADFILLKHQEGYKPEKAVDFLRMIKGVIKNRKMATETAASYEAENPEMVNRRLTTRICAELDKIGISTKAVGYQYLVESIVTCSKTPTQNICNHVAKKYGKTASSVERAMQNAIERTWRTTPVEDLLENYTARIRSDKGVPTLTEFINYYANKMRNLM